MRARSAVAALLLLGAALPTTAAASPGSFPSGSNAAELVRNFWDFVAQGDDEPLLQSVTEPLGGRVSVLRGPLEPVSVT